MVIDLLLAGYISEEILRESIYSLGVCVCIILRKAGRMKCAPGNRFNCIAQWASSKYAFERNLIAANHFFRCADGRVERVWARNVYYYFSKKFAKSRTRNMWTRDRERRIRNFPKDSQRETIFINISIYAIWYFSIWISMIISISVTYNKLKIIVK